MPSEFFAGGASVVNSAPNSRTGDYYLDVPEPDNPTVNAFVDVQVNSIFAGFGIYPVGADAGEFFHISRVGADDYLRATINSTGVVSMGSDTNLGGAFYISYGTFMLPQDEWSYVEIEWLSDNTTGVVRVRVNGAIPAGWSDTTSGDTQVNSTAASIAEVGWSKDSSQGSPVRVDDVYIGDSTSGFGFLGPVEVHGLGPDGSGTSDFLGSDANSVDNHLLLDELPVDVTDYVESSTVADRQLVTLENMPSVGSVIAVKVEAYGLDTEGGGQAVDVIARSVATESSTTKVLGSGADIESHIALLDPNGDIAWTEGAVNALSVGVEVA